MPKITPIRPDGASPGHTAAETVAAARERVAQALAIVRLVSDEIAHTEEVCSTALQAASAILDRAWADLGECAADAGNGT